MAPVGMGPQKGFTPRAHPRRPCYFMFDMLFCLFETRMIVNIVFCGAC